MNKPQVLPLPTGDWVVASSTHKTKGAADKAANKIAHTQIDVLSEPDEREEREVFKHKRHPCALSESAPKHLEVSFGNIAYRFSFYINDEGRYVAYHRGREDVFGEGANWWMAVESCMTKILEK